MEAQATPVASQTKYLLDFQLNGHAYALEIDPSKTLLDVLREELGLTGARRGCETSHCGCCTVLMDGLAVHSCSILAPAAQGHSVTTIEGLASEGRLHPLQAAFVEHGAIQCGYCTPGTILAAKALLDEKSNPTEEEIRRGLDGNLCRCTGYQKIVAAIQAVAGGPDGGEGGLGHAGR